MGSEVGSLYACESGGGRSGTEDLKARASIIGTQW